MKRIIFITSGKISYQIPGLSLYESMYETGMGNIFPHIVDESTEEIKQVATSLKRKNIVNITCAPSNQAKDTAEIFAQSLHIPLNIDKNLLPLRFDLTTLINQEEFCGIGEERYTAIRKRFLKAFLDNRLAESNRNLVTRFNSLLPLMQSIGDGESILAVSHAYLIKLLQIYDILHDDIFKNREEVTRLFNPDKEPLRRLEHVEILFNKQ